jgi:hypothetical protein
MLLGDGRRAAHGERALTTGAKLVDQLLHSHARSFPPARGPTASGLELPRGDAVVDDHVGGRRRALDHGDHGRDFAPVVRGMVDHVLKELPQWLTERHLAIEAGVNDHPLELGRSQRVDEAVLLGL